MTRPQLIIADHHTKWEIDRGAYRHSEDIGIAAPPQRAEAWLRPMAGHVGHNTSHACGLTIAPWHVEWPFDHTSSTPSPRSQAVWRSLCADFFDAYSAVAPPHEYLR